MSGLRINLGKSELVPIGEVEDVESLAHILGCRIGSLPMTYLGMLLGVSFKSISIWNGLLRRWNEGWLVGRNFIYPRVVG